MTVVWLAERRSLRTGYKVIKTEIRDGDRPAMPRHLSLTAELMGDPLPGRSALDQKMAAWRNLKSP